MKMGPGQQLQHHQAIKRQRQTSLPLSLLIHDIESPANVGGLFRLADALGIEHLYLSGSTPTPPNQKLRKAARNCDQWQNYSQHDDIEQLVLQLQQQDTQLLALEITENSLSLDDFYPQLSRRENYRQHYCLIPGSESTGVCDFLLQQCDTAIHIPMHGKNSSMNVVSASSICCYQICRALQQRVITENP